MGKSNLETPERAVKDIRRQWSSQKDVESSQNIWLDKETHKKTLESIKNKIEGTPILKLAMVKS